MWRKYFIISACFFSLSVGPMAIAAASPPPEFNPMCWKAKDCEDVRAKWLRLDPGQSNEQAKNGWVTGEKPCDQEGWGKCLPAGKTVTEISFAGKTEFAHLGEFILFIYKFAVQVAAIVAVVMIIVAGLQYVTSGGNAEMITSAKKRIGGALIGLIIAYLSYTILNTLNPALVNLRLPQIWMVREQNLVPQFCSSAPAGTTFAFAAGTKDQTAAVASNIKPYDLTIGNSGQNPQQAKDAFYCGNRFFIKNGGEQTCFGDYCPNEGEVCVNLNAGGQVVPYHCAKRNIMGKITYQTLPFIPGGWETPEITDKADNWISSNDGEQELWMICNDDKHSMYELSAESKIFEFPTYQFYSINVSSEEITSKVNKCGGPGVVRGFVVLMEMNRESDKDDENHWLGYDGDASSAINQAQDLGDDKFFVKRRGATGLGPVWAISENGLKVDKKYIIPLDKIKKGMILNVNANNVYRITDDSLRDNYKNLFGQ